MIAVITWIASKNIFLSRLDIHLINIRTILGCQIKWQARKPLLNQKINDLFTIETENGAIYAKHVVWSAGEYQYPSLSGFSGVELCRHTATVDSYSKLDGDNFLIIGGYESGIDAAYHLAKNDKKVMNNI